MTYIRQPGCVDVRQPTSPVTGDREICYICIAMRPSNCFNNNNNNPICKAPECQKTSVALKDFRGAVYQVGVIVSFRRVKLPNASDKSSNDCCRQFQFLYRFHIFNISVQLGLLITSFSFTDMFSIWQYYV